MHPHQCRRRQQQQQQQQQPQLQFCRTFFFGGASRRTAVQTTELADVAQQTMFDVVKDVQHYKDFVPFCTSSRVSGATAQDDGNGGAQRVGTFQGTLSVAYGGLYDETYTSDVS